MNRAAWDYIRSPAVANGYDADLGEHPLFRLDLAFIREFLAENFSAASNPVIADFGCGTGRICRALAPDGYRILNVDLSQPMLSQAIVQVQTGQSPFHLRANLVELSCLESHKIDLGVCLFSSLGMIRGRDHRVHFLAEACRSLKKDGALVVHAHNRYRNLFEPGGLTWLLRSWFASLDGRSEFGDRIFPHRELPHMYLHIYSRRELIHDLRKAGFAEIKIVGIRPECDRLLAAGTRLVDLQAGGFFATART